MQYNIIFEQILQQAIKFPTSVFNKNKREMRDGTSGKYKKSFDRGFASKPSVVNKGDNIKGYTDSEAKKSDIIRNIDLRLDGLKPGARMVLEPYEVMSYAAFHRNLDLNEIKNGIGKQINSKAGNNVFLYWSPELKRFYLYKKPKNII